MSNSKKVSFLARLYNEQPLGIDKLPYTKEFSEIVKNYKKTFKEGTAQELWQTLVNLRKAKKLLRKTKSK